MNAQKTYETMRPSAWPWIFRASAGSSAPIACLLLLTTLLASVLPAQAGEKCVGGKRTLDTMTMNLYIGTGVERVLAVDPADTMGLLMAVTGVVNELVASQPPVRIQAVADRIAARMPDVVAVQEATLLQVQALDDPEAHVVFDYLQILVDALKAHGVHYAVVSTSQEWDIAMPMFNETFDGVVWVRQTDREAILVRTDLLPGQLRVSHPQSGNFTNLLQFPDLGLSMTRGWCSVDVCFRGENFRYICAHIEEETSPDIQVAQAKELLAGPVRTCLPVVLVGDFNSDPLHRDRPKGQPTAYPKIIAAGFWDTWALLHPFHPAGGLTWGHDEFLAFPNVAFDRRIDFVFFRGFGIIPVKAEPIDISLGRTAPPLWASDHAALAAELFIW